MRRLTERTNTGVGYIGNCARFHNMPELNQAGSGLRVAAIREIMDRLADYEDTGLTPEQITEMRQGAALKN